MRELTGINAGLELEDDTARRFEAMSAAAHVATGHYLPVSRPDGATRLKSAQQLLYNAYIARGKKPPVVGVPGTSDHEKGRAVDINEDGIPADTNEWLDNNYSRFGFVRNVPGEPWHHKAIPGFTLPADLDIAAIPTTKEELEMSIKTVAVKDDNNPKDLRWAVVFDNGEHHALVNEFQTGAWSAIADKHVEMSGQQFDAIGLGDA